MAVTTYASGTQTPSLTGRSVTDGVTNTTTTITSATAAFVAGDVGRFVTGSADLPTLAYIASVTNGTTALLNAAATASHSGQTFTLSTEFVLSAPNAAATYVAGLDLNALASGDVLEARIYKMGLTTGTPRVYIYQRVGFGDVSADNLIWQTIPVSTALTDVNALVFTIKQTNGTAHAFPWWVEKYA